MGSTLVWSHYALRKQRFTNAVKAIKKLVHTTHGIYLDTETFKNADLGNRVLICTQTTEPLVDKVLSRSKLSETDKKRLRQFAGRYAVYICRKHYEDSK